MSDTSLLEKILVELIEAARQTSKHKDSALYYEYTKGELLEDFADRVSNAVANTHVSR